MTNAERRLLIATARGVAELLRFTHSETPPGRHARRDIQVEVANMKIESGLAKSCPVFLGERCTCEKVV